MSRPRKVHVKSFGCQMNVYDSHRMADTLAPAGFTETAQPDDADLVILNTCHIREKAAEKVYSELGRMRVLKEAAAAQGRRMLIAVAGCVAQAEGEEIVRRAGAVDLVVGSQNYHRLPDLLARAASGEKVVDTEFPVEDKFDALAAPARAGDRQARHLRLRHRAGRLRQVLHLLRRALYARRRSFAPGRADRRRSRAAGRRRRARGHADRAERQRLSRAGRRRRAVDARRNCCAGSREVPGICALRYTTSHPRDMDDDLIAAHGDLPALMPYVHLPVQSGSDRILAAMNRRHTRDDYLAVIARLRAARADLAFSSDFIVGFPGETEEDFRDTLALVDEVGFAGAYSFMYSPRPGTPAADMDDQVPRGGKGRAAAAAASRDHPPSARLQRALSPAAPRRAVGKAGQAPWATGRPLPIFAGGAGHGAAVADRLRSCA